MLFNSFQFILLLLPITVGVFIWLQHRQQRQQAQLWLVAASVCFYASASLWGALALLISGLVNFSLGKLILRSGDAQKRRHLLITGVVLNVAVLIYFKYADFMLATLNNLLGSHFTHIQWLLILGISFITFQQISFLVDIYKGKIPAQEISLLNYAFYITYFPRLVNGPITRFAELIPQIGADKFLRVNYDNLAKGLYIFFIGLFKKVVLADTLVVLVNSGYADPAHLSLIDAWVTSLAYTFQIYFDFSGYIDMAIGVSWMLNIALPFNFNSPYRAQNISDFWKRWHMTLTRFLTDYVYIPLGGSRRGELITLRNVMLTFLISGFWHGVGWTFVFWGFMHGLGMVIHRIWTKMGLKIPALINWFITFNFINIAWVFFRARTFSDAVQVLQSMFGFKTIMGLTVHQGLDLLDLPLLLIIAVSAFISVATDFNTNVYSRQFSPSKRRMVLLIVMIIISLCYANYSVPKGFIYNDF